MGEASADDFHGVANLLLGGQEHQDIPPSALLNDPLHRRGCAFGPARSRLAFIFIVFTPIPFPRRLVTDLHREAASAHLDNGCAAEMGGEFLRIQGGRGDDEFEIPPSFDETVQQTQKNIDIQGTFVCFIHDDGAVGAQGGRAHRLAEKDSVGHQADAVPRGGGVMKTNAAAHGVPVSQFLGDAGGQGEGRDAPGLGTADEPPLLPGSLQAHLGNLGALAAARIAAYNDNRMSANRRDDFGAPPGNGKLFGIAGAEHLEVRI